MLSLELSADLQVFETEMVKKHKIAHVLYVKIKGT